MRTVAIMILALAALSCSKKVKPVHVKSTEDLEFNVRDKLKVDTTNTQSCRDPLSYAPYDDTKQYMEFKTLRLNVHYTNSEDGRQNYTGQEAIDFAKGIVNHANILLRKNEKMNLPKDNSTPQLTSNYQYKIVSATQDPGDDGIYEHYDDELYYFLNKGRKQNNYKMEVIDKYSIGLDSIINIFMMPHHPDSVRSKKYKASRTGISLGNAVKLSGMYETGKPFWEFASNLNHEIGHTLGLRHAWTRSDGCDDTPSHPNCWDNKSGPDCTGLISNNLMDYNNSQSAITPCQLGIMHRNMSNIDARQRSLLMPTWCNYLADRPIKIYKDTKWEGSRDISRDIIIHEGSRLEICCRLGMAPNAGIYVRPGAELVLNESEIHNDCGKKWKGIILEAEGKSRGEIVKLGKVKIRDVEDRIFGAEE